MPPPVKAGTAERYWREVDGLSRLEVALRRDDEIPTEDSDQLIAQVVALKESLAKLAKSRAVNPAPPAIPDHTTGDTA